MPTSAVDNFARTLTGELIQPGDTAYDSARAVFNGMIDKRPRYIAQCAGVDDVVAAVNFGRDNRLDTAIRAGGHSGPGLSLVDNGLVIDLSRMKDVRVDPETRTVRVEGGCRWGEVDRAAAAFGMATVSGVVSTTGVAGLTLGGGHGYLTRKYGLTIDNLLAADMVLADGSIVHTSRDENPDLFWAIRGGGGNFGVVTAFEFRLHPVSQVVAGPMFWPLQELETTMRWYREWLPRAPEDVYAFYLVAEVPSGEPFPKQIWGEKVCGLVWCYLGPESKAQEVIEPARRIASPMFEHIGPMPYPMLQSLFDALLPPGEQWYWKGDFVGEVSDEAIAVHKRFGRVPTPKSTMHLYPIDGAVHGVDAGETAWGHREANWSMVIAGIDPDPANRSKIKEWARSYWEALHPYSLGASYVNFMMEEGEERIQATYGANFERLMRVKAKYDPDNFFHVNQNIRPGSTAGTGKS